MFDVAFISTYEPNSKENLDRLKKFVPWGVREISGVSGIIEAHQVAANKCMTEYFYVVDADNWVIDFDFSFKPSKKDRKLETTFIWFSKNPCNGLVYGHGGIKLFHRKNILSQSVMPMDLTTEVSNNVKVIGECVTEHRFNTDPFSTWRTAFREAAKLTLKFDMDSINRLDHWVDEDQIDKKVQFSDYCVKGARSGQEFAEENFYDEQQLHRINNYEWLRKQFEN